MKASLSTSFGQEIRLRLTRLMSILIDFAATLLIFQIFIMGDFHSEIKVIRGEHPMTIGSISPWAILLLYLVVSLYINKDIIRGQSIAKQILKLQIVSNSTGKVATIYQCFIRNLFLFFLGPVEVVMCLINPSRRVGDIVAGTKLVDYDPELEQPRLNFLQILIFLALPILILFTIGFIGNLVNYN